MSVAAALSSTGLHADEGSGAANGGPPNVPGEYRSIDSFEMAAGVLLRENGTYAYFLTVGARDQTSEGTWRSDGKTIHFTTLPTPVPPELQLAPRDMEEGAPFLAIKWPNGKGVWGVNFNLQCGDDTILDGYTQADGWSPEEKCPNPQWIELWESLYDLPPVRFDLRGQNGGLRFVLIPNSMGIADFTGKTATLEGDVLTLREGDASMKFVRTIPKKPASTQNDMQE